MTMLELLELLDVGVLGEDDLDLYMKDLMEIVTYCEVYDDEY